MPVQGKRPFHSEAYIGYDIVEISPGIDIVVTAGDQKRLHHDSIRDNDDVDASHFRQNYLRFGA